MPPQDPQRQQIARFFTFDDKDREWRERALCRTLDMPVAERVRLFFPVRGSAQKEAKAICAACPVKRECRAYAEKSKSYYGIWGGEARPHFVQREKVASPSETLTLVFGDEPDKSGQWRLPALERFYRGE